MTAKAEPRRTPPRRRKRPWYVKYRKLRRWPKPFVFWFTLTVGLASAGLIYFRGLRFAVLGALAILFVVRILYINDHKGFGSSRDRWGVRYFGSIERVLLLCVVLLNIIALAYRFM
ncbi:hypothetical protein [Rhodocaloribacter sp.]